MNATEGDDLRHIGGDRQDGVGAIAKLVVEQTAMGKARCQGALTQIAKMRCGTGWISRAK